MAVSLFIIGAGVWQLDQNRRASAQANSASSLPAKLNTGMTQAIDFSLNTVDGKVVKLSDLRGKVVLLNFWATWCPPCKAELPDLDALYREYGPEYDFVVVGVDVEEDQATVRDFVQQNRLSYPLLLDGDGQVSNDTYSIRSLPTSMLIDRQGIIRDQWIGQIPKASMLSRLKRVW